MKSRCLSCGTELENESADCACSKPRTTPAEVSEKGEEYLGSIKGETEFARAERLWRIACNLTQKLAAVEAERDQLAHDITFYRLEGACAVERERANKLSTRIQKLTEKWTGALNERDELQASNAKLRAALVKISQYTPTASDDMCQSIASEALREGGEEA